VLSVVGLGAWPKTSGMKGLHPHVPLNTAVTYGEAEVFARTLARQLVLRLPDRVVDRMTRALRAGKVFVDWSHNDPGKSTAAPYSLRGLRAPRATTPLSRDEVATAARRSGPYPAFHPDDVRDRLRRYGDPWPRSSRRGKDSLVQCRIVTTVRERRRH
jgi:bifunctional non-homologous end joining protein LigD